MATTHTRHPGRDFQCSCHAPLCLVGEPSAPTSIERQGLHRGSRARPEIRQSEGGSLVPFGEFLVERRAIDRHQLLRGLQLQDDHPGVRLGECLAALGLLDHAEIEQHLGSWRRAHPAEV